MIRYAFVTITDWDFFPGTLATVNSVLEFHPLATIYIVQNDKNALSAPQAACLGNNPRVSLLHSSEFSHSGRYIAAWELKAYAMADLAESGEYDVLVGIDSDCLLCSDIDTEIRACFQSGAFLGGKDGDGRDFGATYRVYGIDAPVHTERYMSTSLYLCAVNEDNKAILRRWAECCTAAEFNGRGPYPGHGDQGVLNAVLYAAGGSARIQLLDNALWSQHACYWESAIDFRDGAFVNRTAGGRVQRTFHCGGTDKYWSVGHRDRVFGSHPGQMYPYVWYLAMLWVGRCRDWSVDPCQYLPPATHHLAEDLVHALPLVMQVYPPARQRWEALGEPVIDRVLNGIPRWMSLGGGSLSEAIELVAALPAARRYVEIGGYEGGSILAMALRFANRDIQFYSIESFAGNHDGTMDGHRLPSRTAYIANLARFPSLRVQHVPGDSSLAAELFAERSVDILFLDACHDTDALLRDIDRWMPKLAAGAIVAGDDFGWPSVAQAVSLRFENAHVSPSGCVWWWQVPR